MSDMYTIKQLQFWLEDIKKAISTIGYIEDQYSGGIDYEDEDGEHEVTSDDLDDAFHLLCNIEEALNSELKYAKEEA